MANTSNTVALTTDFNVSPYYDDYDPSKGYYRHLFRPGYAIQARELTQIQTSLQKQLDRFGKHIFKEGSIVLPGTFGIYTANSITGPVQYVKVKDTDNANSAVDIADFLYQTVTGQTNDISADISMVLDGTETSTNTKTIYVDYRNVANSNAAIKTFQSGEILVSNAGNLVVVSANSTGFGSAFRISEGVVFAKEHFIAFETQDIILDRYNSSPTCRVGFYIQESIVNSTDDQSLLDPALESSNYTAPGADRLRLDVSLQVVDFADEAGSADFVPLVAIKDGIIETVLERSQYNVLQDELAKRTFDESGHYYVEGLNVAVREHLDDGTNGGRFLSANGGNSQLLSVQVSPGVAYVQGYEVGTLTTRYIATTKAVDYANINSQIASASMGSYLTVKELTGVWPLDVGQEIKFYDTAQTRLTSQAWSTGAQSGNNIGSARLMSIEYDSGTMGTPSAQYLVYLNDIRMNGTNSFSNVKSLYYDNASVADLGADVVLDSSNNAVLQDAALIPLLYYVGSDFSKTLKPGGISDTTFTYKSDTDVSNIATGTFNLSLPAGADEFPYGTTSLSSTQKREIMLAISADTTVSLSGTVANSGKNLIGTSTNFDRLNVGDKLSMNGISGVYYVESIANSSHVTITTFLSKTATGNTVTKTYKNGDLIDLTGKGADAGATRTVSATPTQLSFDLKETLTGTVPATLSYRVSSTSSPQINKTLRPDRYVKINVAGHSSGTSGPYSLGVADVYRIKEIWMDTSAVTSNGQGTNVTTQFVLDSGQRDSMYDFGTITPRSALSGTAHLLVRFDYFEPDYTVGQGFFSVDSYPVDDGNTSTTTIKTAEIPIYKSSTSGEVYDLRNHLDFRPVKDMVATSTTSPGSATTNPGTSGAFDYDVNGLRIPAPYSQITYDYQYYLARKDVVTISKDKVFSVVRGVPSAVPITPDTQDDVLNLATITIAPYPSLSLYYANQVERKDLACAVKKTASVRFTMRDIGVLKDRIVNLEYYAALSLLEKAALDMKILDSDGLDRFKNGIFVDTFSSHALGATYSGDYRIVVDPYEKSIRPIYTMDSTYYNYVSGSNVTRNGDIITLNYSEVELLAQNNVTSTRNTERSTFRYIGKMVLSPDNDVWVDTAYAPDQSVTFNVGDTTDDITDEVGLFESGINTTWNSWQTNVTGYKVYRGTSATQDSLVGSFATMTEAELVANQIRQTSTASIETMFASVRSGIENYSVVGGQTQSLGDKVINVEIIPFIRPQIIKIMANGLKPYGRYYTYFDGQNLSSYVTPITSDQYSANTIALGVEGSEVKADANGTAYLMLRIPNDDGKRFYTGTKEVKLTDSPTNSIDESSFSVGHFVAQGLVQQKQEDIISTRQVINRRRTVTESTNGSTVLNLPQIVQLPDDPVLSPGDSRVNGGEGDCLAYAFTVKAPPSEEGVFITSVDVFCSDKHPTLGIWFEIRETDAAGMITLNQVPLTYVRKSSSEITLSTDGITNATNVQFQAPIFLQNNKTYAFCMHPEGSNPNYYFWAARIGETDVNTGRPVNSRQFKGTMFTTNNNIIWDIVPDVDLTFRLYRASFSTGVTGTATLGNKPREKFWVANLSSSLTNYGETYRSGDRLTLSSVSGPTINVGDLIIGNTSAQNSAIVSIDTTYWMANTGYSSGEGVYVRAANGVNRGISAIISSIDPISIGTLTKSQETAGNVVITIDNSTGRFKANDKIFSVSHSKNAVINRIDKFRYSVVDIEPAYLKFSRTTIGFSLKTWSNTGTEGAFVPMNPNENYYFSDERAMYSRSTEVASYSSANTMQMQVSMSTTSNYQSPVLDLARTHTIYVDNIVNTNTTNEVASTGGALYNKYISKTVTLAEGQDAEDMRVVLTAYRPPTSDIKVYAKILHAEDSDSFASRPWIEMERTESSSTTYSSLSDRNDFIEYQFGFPTANLTGSLGQVQYRNTANTTTFTGYKYYAIKIGLTAENSAVVPRVADLQVLAIQV
jgi:hypothetical protein